MADEEEEEEPVTVQGAGEREVEVRAIVEAGVCSCYGAMIL